jgi:hypothetical protein
MDNYAIAILVACVSIAAAVIALIIFVVVFCRARLKEDSNVRKRIITKDAVVEERQIEYDAPTEVVQVPTIQPPPPPIPMPIVLPPPPPPPAIIPEPPPPEPRVIIREVIRDREPEPEPRRVVRRNSWSGANDDWVLVKKVKKRRSRRDSGSSDSSSSDDEETVRERPCMRPAMVPVTYNIPRLNPYDLAMTTARPVMAMTAAPVAMTAVPTTQPGYVSVMMPQ